MGEKNQLLQKKIIKHLYYAGTLSSAELCLKISKSLPIATRVITNLLETGLIVETGFAPSTGGRRPVTYSLAKDKIYIISVAMDQFITRIAVVDVDNNFIKPEWKFELPLPHNSEALGVLIGNIKKVIASAGINKSQLAGVGIGMPGFVDIRKGINYSFLPVAGKSLRDYIADSVGLPVFYR